MFRRTLALLILDGDLFHFVALLDGVHDFLRVFDYLAEDRMFVVEPGRGGVRDEELRTVGVWAGVRHRKNAGAAVLEIFVKFVGKLIAGAASARAFRAAALDHEVVDHAVERQTVVEAVFRELFEISDRFRRFVVVQLEADIAMLRFNGCRFHFDCLYGLWSVVR
jgi:hypothetical protein